MTRDFTLTKYRELMAAVGPGDFTFRSYLENGDQFAIIRHDVDSPPKNVPAMAAIENRLGIKATYFFRVGNGLFDPTVISEVKKLGHEVGYHYEVLDKAGGDYEKAIRLFEEEWRMFAPWDASTICMHGNPLTPYVNKDTWKRYDFKEFSVRGEAYLSVDFTDRFYFTDTGRTWNTRNASVKDRVDQELQYVKDTGHLIDMISGRKYKKVYILAHPEAWNDALGTWLFIMVWQKMKNVIKRAIVLFQQERNNIPQAN